MKRINDNIETTNAERWDNRELGASEEHVSVADERWTSEIDKAVFIGSIISGKSATSLDQIRRKFMRDHCV